MSLIIKFVLLLLLSIAWNSCNYWNYLNQKHCIQNVLIDFLNFLLIKTALLKVLWDNDLKFWLDIWKHEGDYTGAEHLPQSAPRTQNLILHTQFQKISLLPKGLAGGGMFRHTGKEQELLFLCSYTSSTAIVIYLFFLHNETWSS